MDLPEAYENWESFKEKLQSWGITPFCMSAVKSEGTHEVICAAHELLRKSKEDNEEYDYEGYILLCTYSVYFVTLPEYSFFLKKAFLLNIYDVFQMEEIW